MVTISKVSFKLEEVIFNDAGNGNDECKQIIDKLGSIYAILKWLDVKRKFEAETSLNIENNPPILDIIT